MKYVPSVAKVKLAEIDVADVKETEFALVIAPVELIASTVGTDTKLVPVIVILVASLVITEGLIPVIVGLVSPTVTDPPRLIAEPLIVIALLANLDVAIAADEFISALSIEPSSISDDVRALSAGFCPTYAIFYSPYELIVSTKLIKTSIALAVSENAFTTSPVCITILLPESINSKELPVGIGAPLITL